MSLLRAENLSCGYGGRRVLHAVDLALGPGELVGLLGPNGAGKSTLLLALSGALTPASGRVLAGGDDLYALPPKARARLVAAVPQRPDLTFDLAVRELVLLGRYPHLGWLGTYGPEDEAAADAALAATGSAELAGRAALTLSGGELQRVLIARALAQEAGVLLLDEATSGLDIARKAEVHAVLEARRRQGLGILAAIHDLNQAALHCERLVFLKEGRVVLDGPTQDVFTADAIRRVYDCEVRIIEHPDTGAPQCLAVPLACAGGSPHGGACPLPGRTGSSF